jgi:hypothetical protein|tara:strand:- start:1156 stop:1377 length:222 start_codon:yes stop_codon:yes gene_type:complete
MKTKAHRSNKVALKIEVLVIVFFILVKSSKINKRYWPFEAMSNSLIGWMKTQQNMYIKIIIMDTDELSTIPLY